MNLDPTALFLSIVFGAIGMALFIYGKRQQKYVHLFIGALLMAIPYFIANVIALIVVGVILLVMPYVFG